MPDIQAFRALRYDLGHVGSLSAVVAPPYDAIDRQLQDALYKQHAANVVRLILNREEPGDDAQSNRYSRAARFLKNWCREGVLRKDSDPALYVYHQTFSEGGQEYTRRGFMGRVRLSRFGEGDIHPHEQTYASAKADRLRLMRACKANLSQVFGLYPDPDNRAQGQLDAAIQAAPPVEATDSIGVVHRLWPVTDIRVIAAVSGVMGATPIFVADGHHRYETACDYRDQLAQREPNLPPNHPANFVLMMCVSLDDPGMLVLPTHRLLRGIPPVGSAELIAKLGDCFTTQRAGKGSELAGSVGAEIQRTGDQATLALFCQEDERWVIARLTSQGRARLAVVAADQSRAWRGLGVAILHRLIIETLLDIKRPARPKYLHQVDEVARYLRTGDLQGERFPLAVLTMAPTLDDVREISEQGERMPAKSTYFYPKVLSGLVINPLE